MRNLFLVLISLLFSQAAYADASLFSPRQNYCKTHECSYQKTAPGTILMIHGMSSSMEVTDGTSNKPSGKHIVFARYLEQLGKGQKDFKVYSIDYNSDYHLPNRTVKIRPLRNPVPNTCMDKNDWQNCWDNINQWESPELYGPNQLNIRAVSHGVQQLLIKMAQEGTISNPVTIVGHSMGGLITRDLLYYSHDNNLTGYEILRQNGVVINEVITLGTPHDHGFTGSELADYRTLSCKILEPNIKFFGQFCMLTDWIAQQQASNAQWSDGTKIEINAIDYPQIHWVAAAGLGMALPDATPGDGVVALDSALYTKDGKQRFHQKVGLKTSSSPHYSNPIPADLSGGFPQGTDVIHGNLMSIGMFPNPQQCASTNLRYPSIACVGFFQYVVPQTSLCLLPGYSENNPYYRDNSGFSTVHWGCRSW
jgi:hypothetical protein